MISVMTFLAPKISFAALLVIYLVWQTSNPGPEWKDLALWSMGIVSTFAIAGFSFFVRKIGAMEKIQKRRHNANIKVMLGIMEAIRTGNIEKLDISELLESEEE
jgi:hypothetical protein